MVVFRPDYVAGVSAISGFAGQETSKRGVRVLEAQRVSEDRLHRSELALRRSMRFEEVHASATQASKFGKANLSINQNLHGYIVRAIAKLPPLQMSWVHARYRTYGNSRHEHQREFVRRYYRRFEKQHLKGFKAETRLRAEYLVYQAIRNHMFEWYKPDRKVMNISQDQWRKTYKSIWKTLCEELAVVDESALFQIGCHVTELDGS